MTFDFDNSGVESRIGFMTNPLLRDAENRDETSLPIALERPDARFFIFSGPKVLLRGGDEPAVAFLRETVDMLGGRMEEAILLGHMPDGGEGEAGGIPCLAVPAEIEEEGLAEPFKLETLRGLLYSGAVSAEEASIAAQASAMLHWHGTNRFCGRCGEKSAARIGGFRRDCPACGLTIFPRTDPVVIMLAVKGDRAVMGRSPHFPAGWYSTLAGFMEPGETVEDAVRREIFEESGIRVGRVGYHASQPWPFPHSLMIGCICEAVSEDIEFQVDELEDCRWFTREEVRMMIEGTHPDGLCCPPRKAISFELIRSWCDG